MGRGGKPRASSEVCSDCSAAGPEWVSINRGVMVCDECCSVHRSLGRHISQVRHLRLAPWTPSLLAMVRNLVGNGANLIWEHSLSDANQSKNAARKPNPKDQVHPTKSTFIKAKYEMLAFSHRLPNMDDRLSIVDLSKQLYAAVKTSSLETSLRLISLGAQPNFFHPDKGNTPLHVAASAGQATQCELLITHGANASALDENSKTAAEAAMEADHIDLSFRLIESQYELTDRLTFYLCGRRPDHRKGVNYLIPALQDRGIGASSAAKEARCKLETLTNRLFEELCSDVYDEVDRRENDAVWLATQHHHKIVSDHTAVPFLPVNPAFTSTRNQGRQKLARFNALEFATLIVDILHDAKRREGANIDSLVSTTSGIVETNDFTLNDGPDYDDIDHDYDEVPDDDEKVAPSISISEDHTDGKIKSNEASASAFIKNDGNTQELHELNSTLVQEVNLLRSMVQKLMQEGATLRAQISQLTSERDELEMKLGGGVNKGGNSPANADYARPQTKEERMREAELQSLTKQQQFLTEKIIAAQQQHNLSALPSSTDPALFYNVPKHPVSVSSSDRTDSSADPSRSRSDTYDNMKEHSYQNTQGRTDNKGTGNLGIEYLESSEESTAFGTEDEISDFRENAGPSQEDIVRATEQITKKIQELLLAAQGGRNSRYIPCSSNISAAVNDMANLFPKHPSSEGVRMALRLMITSAARLQVECRSSVLPEKNIDQAMLTQQVIQCAYDIAKAAKQLVTTYNGA